MSMRTRLSAVRFLALVHELHQLFHERIISTWQLLVVAAKDKSVINHPLGFVVLIPHLCISPLNLFTARLTFHSIARSTIGPIVTRIACKMPHWSILFPLSRAQSQTSQSESSARCQNIKKVLRT